MSWSSYHTLFMLIHITSLLRVTTRKTPCKRDPIDMFYKRLYTKISQNTFDTCKIESMRAVFGNWRQMARR
jgi:hypothetical protein